MRQGINRRPGRLNPGAGGAISGIMRSIPPVPERSLLSLAGNRTLRRAGGFALLGCSLWLVSLLAMVRSVFGWFQ